MQVPYFRPEIGEAEIAEVVECLRSGWLTTGPRVGRFEKAFCEAVGGEHALAINSCTAALHLGVEALELGRSQGVLLPAMTFAATAEVVRYQGAYPILVDCDPVSLNMDMADAAKKLDELRAGKLPVPEDTKVVGMIPVHVGGAMMDIGAISDFAKSNDLWVVEDAAHAFPSSWRKDASSPWIRCGEGTADVSCYSFYANKTMTTGEGGMAVSNRKDLIERMRVMALHGLSQDAWQRYSGGRSWDYQIVAPGFKYNLTDIAAAIGLHQLERAEQMRKGREAVAMKYLEAFADQPAFECPTTSDDRIDSWHLFPIRLVLDALSIDRNSAFEHLREAGVRCSVHWRPLHLHPYYKDHGWTPEHCPVATATFDRLISLPIFSGQTDEEVEHVIKSVKELCAAHGR